MFLSSFIGRYISNYFILNSGRCFSSYGRFLASKPQQTTHYTDSVYKVSKDITNVNQEVLHGPPRKSRNPSLLSVSQVFNTSTTGYLPLVKPNNIKEGPFEFQSRYSTDKSYISTPRLSVTKLLTDSWCELREYYRVYSQLAPKKTFSMSQGSALHEKLENSSHPVFDVTNFNNYYNNFMKLKISKETQRIEDITDPIIREDSKRLLELLSFQIGELTPECACAKDWSDKILSRLFTLVTTSQAREINLQCYIDLHSSTFIKSNESISSNSSTLLGGVIDLLKIENIENPQNLQLFEDINTSIDYGSRGESVGINIESLLSTVSSLIKEYETSHTLKVVDIKTRYISRVPEQESVRRAAFLQTSYYRKMLGLLIGEGSQKHAAYAYYLESARRRGLDVDKPLSLKLILSLANSSWKLLYDDFQRLSSGKKIGFDPFDKFAEKNYKPVTYYYPNFFDETEICMIYDALTSGTESKVEKSAIRTLLMEWKYPLTLRYFAARMAQFYDLLYPLLGKSLEIQYFNARLGRCFNTQTYTYDEDELNKALAKACTFWDGQREPNVIDDITKCKNCDFKSKCIIPNQVATIASKNSVGQEIRQFIAT